MKQSFATSIIFSVVIYTTLITGSNASMAQIASVNKSPVKESGHQLNNTVIAAIASAKVGGALGTSINKQMDRQASELKNNLREAKVMRFEEGIVITIDSKVLFGEDSDGIQDKKELKELARILSDYPFTNVVIESHTDNVAEDIYNQSLTERRAHEIEVYLIKKGIDDARMKTRGYGERQPIASNETERGRQMNRRIEIGIYANEMLRNVTTAADTTYSALKQ
jgi:outer membrane protein OmpA-like peptidoglycan-associated protein